MHLDLTEAAPRIPHLLQPDLGTTPQSTSTTRAFELTRWRGGRCLMSLVEVTPRMSLAPGVAKPYDWLPCSHGSSGAKAQVECPIIKENAIEIP